MEIFGFIVLVMVGIFMTMFYLVMLWDGMGQYNIGGVSNTLYWKSILIAIGFCIAKGWQFIFEVSPFYVIST